ncbi:hypothetical protein ACIGXM_10205 [Kitasatospora sp. NPDC052896]|uniref:hypothetical protein n=1 Tax=Kitasatospora sp. NPDC052896 TaxID=3364061 RepID=UPI0037C9B0B0
MTDTRGTEPVWNNEPLVTSAPQPDWAALAERHERQVRRRRQIRAAAAGVVATTAIGGLITAAVQFSGSGQKSAHSAASSASAAATTANSFDGGLSPLVAPTGTASGAAPSGSPSASADPSTPASASAGTGAAAGTSRPVTPTGSGAAGAAAPTAGSAPAAGGAPAAPAAPAPSADPTPKASPTTPPPTGHNPYSAGQVCGGGYSVIDSHSLGSATVYLLYDNANGDNCVATLANDVGGAVPMNATLAVKGGSSASNPGSFSYYAGPVTEHAPNTCVEWGGSYQGSSWTSGWSHCGS